MPSGDEAEPSRRSGHGDLNKPHQEESTRSQSSKFRFKSKRKSDTDDRPRSSSMSHGHRSHRHHHRTKRRKQPPPDDPTLYDDTYLPNASSEQYVEPDPDAAFRESLFDAMADDEGAQFWEGVYGQPIPRFDPVKEGPRGELEAMTEDEYAAHVRAEMYKKTHQHLLEEKERRDKLKRERERLAEEGRREERESERFRMKVEESLRRGRERKDRTERASGWIVRWKEYEAFWEALADRNKQNPTKIPWPTWQGTRDDITKEEVERFFLSAPTSGKPEEADLAKILKAERVRWHPDKIQQKLGGQSVDAAKMRSVTAVFQIIDRMWSEAKELAR